MADGRTQSVVAGASPARREVLGHDHRFACVNLVPIFAGLSDEDRHRIASIALTRHYDHHEQVYGPRDDPGLHIVHRGKVKVYRLTESGSEQLIRILAPGDFLGEAALLADQPVDQFAVAIGGSEVCTIRRSAMVELLTRRPVVALGMLQAVSDRLLRAEQRLSWMSGQSVEQRLAQHLLSLSAEAGSPVVQLPSTKKDLASYLGTTAETLSRRLAAMQTAGLIRLSTRRGVEILDAAGMRDVAAALHRTG